MLKYANQWCPYYTRKFQQIGFELEDINEVPISFDIGWYEQKAVAVLLSLLSLGVKGITIGPNPPGFVTPNVFKVLFSLILAT